MLFAGNKEMGHLGDSLDRQVTDIEHVVKGFISLAGLRIFFNQMRNS